MGIISLVIPQIGQPDTTEDVKVQNAFTTIQTVINGNIDSTNVSASLAQSAIVNQSGQTVKGASIIATSESRANVAYGTLTTPDQVTGIVLSSSGLIVVAYQAMWQESVAGAAKAALFIGANQVKLASAVSATPIPSETQTNASGAANQNIPLYTFGGGLSGIGLATPSNYTGDVTTGQIIGALPGSGSVIGGPCLIFATAGTYTVSVQFKASSGTVTAASRRLYVQALSFA